MSTDRETQRIVRSWLHTDEHESPERMLQAVLDLVESTPQRRAPWWLARRNPTMDTALRIAIAAAAVVAMAVGTLVLTSSPGPIVGGPSPTPAISPSPAATTSAAPSAPLASPGPIPGGGALAPGTFHHDTAVSTRVSVAVPDDWRVWHNGEDGFVIFRESVDPPRGRGLFVMRVDAVFANACDASAGTIAPSGARDLAEALAGQARTNASAITDVTLAGRPATHVEYSMTSTPDDTCLNYKLDRWPTSWGTREALERERDQVWIVDIDGQLLVADAFSFAQVTENELAELRAIVESITIGS